MKSLHHTKKHSYLLTFAASTLAVVIISGGAYAYYLSQQNTSPEPADQQTTHVDEQPSAQPDPQQKESVAAPSNEDVDVSLAPSEVPQAHNVNVTIDDASQQDMTVSYRATVTGATHGTCNAQFTSTYGRPVSKVSKLSNGICSQSINAVEFDALGEWKMTLYFYVNNTKATATTNLTIR